MIHRPSGFSMDFIRIPPHDGQSQKDLWGSVRHVQIRMLIIMLVDFLGADRNMACLQEQEVLMWESVYLQKMVARMLFFLQLLQTCFFCIIPSPGRFLHRRHTLSSCIANWALYTRVGDRRRHLHVLKEALNIMLLPEVYVMVIITRQVVLLPPREARRVL